VLTVDFKTFRPASGEWVLDAGCGEGRHTFALCRSASKVFALDRDATSLRKTQYVLRELERQGDANGSVLILRGDNLQLPFRDGTFHKIICAEVMEHIGDDRGMVRELFRVLRPRGEMAVTVPTPFTERVYGRLSRRYFRTPGGHIRIYRSKAPCRILTEAGLRIYAVGYAHAFHSLYWVLRCLCGLENENAAIPKLYHRFLHRAVLDPRLRKWEASCNYLFPKSMVVYAQKPASARNR
jgi:ubiquinone/menaquinone biosynthesis C-methylase UbiE